MKKHIWLRDVHRLVKKSLCKMESLKIFNYIQNTYSSCRITGISSKKTYIYAVSWSHTCWTREASEIPQQTDPNRRTGASREVQRRCTAAAATRKHSVSSSRAAHNSVGGGGGDAKTPQLSCPSSTSWYASVPINICHSSQCSQLYLYLNSPQTRPESVSNGRRHVFRRHFRSRFLLRRFGCCRRRTQ